MEGKVFEVSEIDEWGGAWVTMYWHTADGKALSLSLGLGPEQMEVVAPNDSSRVKRVLFICSQNRLRSPTAEQLFSNRAGFEVASAGLNNDAETLVSPELLEWADVIFVMERAHRNRLSKRFRAHLKSKRIICLDIPDQFEYMDPALVRLLEAKVGSFFNVSGT